MGYKIKRIYQGTNLVRPKYIVCDFTQSDCGFTFRNSHPLASYGRNSNGFYGTSGVNQYRAISWKPPQSLYSKGALKKVEIQAKTTTAGGGCGISYNLDTDYSRVWWQGNMKDWNSAVSTTTLNSYPPANTVFTYTIDLENKVQYYSIEPSKTLALNNSDVSLIQTYWSNGVLDIVAMLYNVSGTTTYIQKATFYF